MSPESIRVGLVGARGYVGAELIRLLAAHPRFELAYVSSRELVGQRLADHNDAYRGDLQALRRSVAPVPVLRPMFERRPGLHAGPPQQQFCSYGLLRENGDVEALADGALAP